MRTFIAIDLDEALKKSLAATVEELRPLGRNVRWVGPAGMHLTLRFLGEITDQDSYKVCQALEQTVGEYAEFDLTLKGTGVFPPGRRNPRILWVGVEDQTILIEMQRDLERSLEKMGFEKEKREYHPHLTLGRVKYPSPINALLDELEKKGDRPLGRMRVRKVTLFQSVLKPSGAEYSVLAEFKLR